MQYLKKRKHECVPKRLTLYFVTLNGITMTFILRMSINLTILAMVKDKPKDKGFNATEELCSVGNYTHEESVNYGGTLDWTLDNQFSILSSFYWTYILAQIIGGISTQKFGAKRVFGWSLLVSSLCNLCVPFCSYIHYAIVVILQIVHGFAQGLTWPAIYSIISIWIPIQERSRFVSCFQGLSLGKMLANLLSAFIIVKFGWIYVFYFTGMLGILSTLLWYLLMYDKPEQHPCISDQELYYIQVNREQCLHSQKSIPWVSILMSLPAWGIAISSFGRIWKSTILHVFGPLYLKTVVGLTMEQNGLLLGTSSFAAFLFVFVFSYASDKIVSKKLMPIILNRKIFAAIGQIIPATMLILLCYTHCNIVLVATNWFLIELFSSANFSGVLVNIVDISPNYAGPVSSFIQVILLLPTILSPIAVKYCLQHQDTLEAWNIIFLTTSGIVIISYIFYVITASGKVQTWDLAKNSRNLNNRQVDAEYLESDSHVLDKMNTMH